MTKHEARKRRDRLTARASPFRFPSAFVIRTRSFSSRPTHARHLWERENSVDNFLARQVFDLCDRDRVGDVEPSRRRSSQRFQMRAAAEEFANVVRVCPNVKAFATQH